MRCMWDAAHMRGTRVTTLPPTPPTQPAPGEAGAGRGALPTLPTEGLWGCCGCPPPTLAPQAPRAARWLVGPRGGLRPPALVTRMTPPPTSHESLPSNAAARACGELGGGEAPAMRLPVPPSEPLLQPPPTMESPVVPPFQLCSQYSLPNPLWLPQ